MPYTHVTIMRFLFSKVNNFLKIFLSGLPNKKAWGLTPDFFVFHQS
jgi:hypothetical protein